MYQLEIDVFLYTLPTFGNLNWYQSVRPPLGQTTISHPLDNKHKLWASVQSTGLWIGYYSFNHLSLVYYLLPIIVHYMLFPTLALPSSQVTVKDLLNFLNVGKSSSSLRSTALCLARHSGPAEKQQSYLYSNSILTTILHCINYNNK